MTDARALLQLEVHDDHLLKSENMLGKGMRVESCGSRCVVITWKRVSISSSPVLPSAPSALLPQTSSHLGPASAPPPHLRGDQGLQIEILGQPPIPSQFPHPHPTCLLTPPSPEQQPGLGS